MLDIGNDGAALADDICAEIPRVVMRRSWHACLVDELHDRVLTTLEQSDRFHIPHPMDVDCDAWLIVDSPADLKLHEELESDDEEA